MADIISKDPISNEYVDRVIKANEILDENSANTQGIQLRKLVKDLRDRLETEVSKKVDKDGNKILSDVNWTEEEKDHVLTAVDNFDNLSNTLVNKTYVDEKFDTVNSSVSDLQGELASISNGSVQLIGVEDSITGVFKEAIPPDIPGGVVMYYNTYLGKETANGPEVYVKKIPQIIFSDDRKGLVRISGLAKINTDTPTTVILTLLVRDVQDQQGLLSANIILNNSLQPQNTAKSNFTVLLTKANNTEINCSVTNDGVQVEEIIKALYNKTSEYEIVFLGFLADPETQYTIEQLTVEVSSFAN